MRLIHSWILGIVLLIPLCIMSVQLACTASQSEIGWETLRLQWWDSTVGWCGWKHKSIHDAVPAEQAEFWLREADRVLSTKPRTAGQVMGGAWVLDSPGIGFFQQHIRPSPYAKIFPQFGPELDQKAIASAENQFETQCQQQCLTLAALATKIEPEDVRWWRMRALLQFRCQIYSEQWVARHPDWLEVLDECARHDPNNALYE